MQDYQANSNKAKLRALEGKNEDSEAPKPKKTVEKVVVGEVVVRRKGLRHKFREVIAAADMRSVGDYVMFDVLIPALRNTVVDVSTKGIERMMFGDSARSRRPIHGPDPRFRFPYETPVSRSYPYNDPRQTPRQNPRQDERRRPSTRSDYLCRNRADAEFVLETMQNIIDQYEVCTVADLNEMMGLQSAFTDSDWGWINLVGATVRQTRDGYLLDIPPAEPIPTR